MNKVKALFGVLTVVGIIMGVFMHISNASATIVGLEPSPERIKVPVEYSLQKNMCMDKSFPSAEAHYDWLHTQLDEDKEVKLKKVWKSPQGDVIAFGDYNMTYDFYIEAVVTKDHICFILKRKPEGVGS